MKIIAKSLIKHNGNYYQAGDELPSMSEKEASVLLAANSVKIEDGKVAPIKPEDARTLPITPETKGVEETANMPINASMKKTILIGVARANKLVVEQTATPAEVYAMIKEHRKNNGIVVEDAEVSTKVVAPNPQAPKKDEKKDKKENAPSGANPTTDKK